MPTFADTDGSTLKVVEETVFGTTPSNSPDWKSVRAKGWNLKPAQTNVESEEISSNVDVLDAITVNKMAQWSMTGEYAKDATFETLLEHLFRSTFTANVLKGGILKKSLSFEELTVGAANEYAVTAGCRVDSFSMTGAIGRIIETSFSGMGTAVALGATSAVGTGTTAAPGTNRALSLSDLTAFTMTGDTTPLTVLDFSLQVQNQTREQFGAGAQTLQGIGYGTRRVSGNFTAYFETREQLEDFNNGTKKDLQFVLTDGTNSHTWRLPSIKLMDADKAVSGRSADITQKIEFLGLYNAAQATSAMVTRTA